jgi:predicted DNA-binding transcriptional regulator YafY
MRADRLVAMTLLLQGRGKMTTQALADELGVSRRTILRDVEALSMAGIPVYADGGHGGGVALDENYRVSLTGLKDAEVRALFLSGNTQLLEQIGLGEAAQSTLLKLFAALPEPHQPSVDYIRQRIYIDPLWWWHDSEPQPFWDELQQAVYEDRLIEATYENYDGEVAGRTLAPYSLVAKSSLWYLIARRDDELRTYRVSRFHRVKVLDKHFERPPDFNLETYWQEHLQEFAATLSEYSFTLKVHSSRINFVRWLAPGRCEILSSPESDEGWYTARLHYESPVLAQMLVFGLGAEAQVVGPDELREAVVGAAQDLLKHYG